MTLLDVPKHIAIIMDGNGRWAQKRMLGRADGHREGVNSARSIIEGCIKSKIETLSLFAFSSENWRRPPSEVDFLMSLLVMSLNSERESLLGNGVRVSVIGDREPLSTSLIKAIDDVENATRKCDRIHLLLAINYGGMWEVVRATKLIAEHVADGTISLNDINENTFGKYCCAPDVSYPDLLIRTGGERRLSNYHLWQVAYSELYFSDCLWPDYDESHLIQAIDSYRNRQRRYGALFCGSGDLALEGLQIDTW